MMPRVTKVIFEAEGRGTVSAARTGAAVEVGRIVVDVLDWRDAVRREVTKDGDGVDERVGKMTATADGVEVEIADVVEMIEVGGTVGARMGAILVKIEMPGATT